MEKESVPLLALLKQHFGFASFRPLQEEIIRDVLEGRDVFALLPTGGGKSLCFQLPALARPGLTVVVSPLIALMKDQVDALCSSGIAATFLNSSLAPGESAPRLRGLHNGEYRLLYVAPERLMLSGFLEDLARWNVTLLAVDEAHCISEWGHDFRPEYRQLAELRRHLPGVTMMALTATATDRVRADILQQLRLREPRSYVASFNRPNLTYRVVPKDRAYEQVLEFVRQRPKESGIIYCQSRKGTEGLASRLSDDGIAARPYHAGLEARQRSEHQDLFLRDEVRVICATIAFGMGINKPNVRYVIHYDLPKNLESYYQETGRAGRDGLPSECVLLFSAADVAKQNIFIEQKPDPKEQQLAREQLNRMLQYAESSKCRRVTLLGYFGEQWPDGQCNSCDNCLTPRQSFDGTLAAQKLLSCVYRIRDKSGFAVGIAHVVEVLTGANTEKVRKWGHDQLSTYGIGKEFDRREWASLGRELIRMGYLRQREDKFNVVELTVEGRAALKERKKISLTQPPPTVSARASGSAGQIACDEALFERLRQLRKRLADERNLPPYIVFSDVALRQMARNYPGTPAEFSRITGVGERKLAEYGVVFMNEIAVHLQANPKQIFAEESFQALPARARLSDSVADSLRRFLAGQTVADIAQERELASGTIYSHLAAAVEAGQTVPSERILTPEEQVEVAKAFAQIGFGSLSGVRELLGNRFEYGQLRVFRALHGSRG